MTIRELMDVEKRLYEVRDKDLLDLGIVRAVQLDDAIREIGRYTSRYFTLCQLYYDKIMNEDNSEDLLKEYVNKLLSEKVDIVSDISQFLD